MAAKSGQEKMTDFKDTFFESENLDKLSDEVLEWLARELEKEILKRERGGRCGGASG